MAGKRIVWVDTVKALCMFAVIIEHVECVTPVWDQFVAPFFLNMFSFAAGYVYVHREGFAPFFRKKLRQLWVPWLFYSVLVILLSHLYSFQAHKSLAAELWDNLLQIHYRGDEMWYIAALFVAFLPFYFVIRAFERSPLPRRQKTARLVFGSLALCLGSHAFSLFFPRSVFPWSSPELPVVLPWHLEYAPQVMFFMVLGYLFRGEAEARFDRGNGPARCALLWTAALFADFVLARLLPESTLFQALLFYLRAFLSCTALISLSKLLPADAFLRFLGQNTLGYYGLHGKAESLLQALFRRVGAAWYENLVWCDPPYALPLAMLEGLLVSLLLIVPVRLCASLLRRLTAPRSL